MSEARLYRGMRDFLPQQSIAREKILEKVRLVFKRWGYVPIETPAIELLSTLLGKYGEEADKLIYRIDHPDGLGLRYDLTVPLARVIALYKQELPNPFRRYQIQSVWRAERAQKQKGRFREFTQCDVDIIGSDSPAADAEILAISAEILDILGLKGYKILLNHRNILRGLVGKAGFSPEEELTVVTSMDKLDKIGRDGVEDELSRKGFSQKQIEKLFQFAMVEGGNWEILAYLDKHDDERISHGVNNLRKIMNALGAFGIGQDSLTIAPRMARGLDYYTGAIFESFLPKLPHMGSLTGGGRYDNLIGMFANEQQIPACGTTVGLDRIMAAMEEMKILPIEHTFTLVLVTVFSDELLYESLQFAQKLRREGIPCEVFPEAKKLSKQFAYADKWKIPYVVVIGDDESQKDVCLLKELDTGSQRLLSKYDAAKIIKELIRNRFTAAVDI